MSACLLEIYVHIVYYILINLYTQCINFLVKILSEGSHIDRAQGVSFEFFSRFSLSLSCNYLIYKPRAL